MMAREGVSYDEALERQTALVEERRAGSAVDTLLLLQHPREAKVAVGTARMAHLSLPNSELHTGVSFEAHPRVRERMEDLKMGHGPYFTFHRPYHLTSLEVPLTCARVVLYGKPDMVPLAKPAEA